MPDTGGDGVKLEQIEQRHRNCSPHIKQRQTWKDMDALLAVSKAAAQVVVTRGNGKADVPLAIDIQIEALAVALVALEASR
jgi:hypothetical protein